MKMLTSKKNLLRLGIIFLLTILSLPSKVFAANTETAEERDMESLSLQLSKERLILKEDGDGEKLTPVIDGSNISFDRVSCFVSDEKIVRVTSWGWVYPKSPGKATITCMLDDNNEVYTTCEVIVKPGKVKAIKLKEAKEKEIKFSWSKASGVSGYIISCYDTGEKKWNKVKSVGASTTSIKIKKVVQKGNRLPLKASTTYKFRVAAYVEVKGKKYVGAYSKVKTLSTCPGAVKGVDREELDSGQYKITWKRVPGASGYTIYYKSRFAIGGGYYYYDEVTDENTTQYICDSSYYYAIMAYRIVNGDYYDGKLVEVW